MILAIELMIGSTAWCGRRPPPERPRRTPGAFSNVLHVLVHPVHGGSSVSDGSASLNDHNNANRIF
jgi:hypothetical protein